MMEGLSMFRIHKTMKINYKISDTIKQQTKIMLYNVGMEAVKYIVENRFSKTYKREKGRKVAGNEPATDKYSVKYGLKTINNITGALRKSIQSFVIDWDKLVVGSFGVFYAKFFELSKKLEKYRIFKPTIDFIKDKINSIKGKWWQNIKRELKKGIAL